LDSDGSTDKAQRRSRRRGEPRLGTDEESAAKIRDAIKASLARAHGEWVQLKDKDEAAATPAPEPQTTVTIETQSPTPAAPEPDVSEEEGAREEEATGRALREAREKRSITLDQASSDTRIAKRYLEALEEGTSPDRLPSRAYARFFLRDYSRYLGVADDEIGEVYRGGADEPNGGLGPLSTVGSRPRRRWVTVGLVAAGVAGVIALGVTRIDAPQQEPLPTAPRSSPGIVAPSLEPTPTPPPARATKIVAVLRVSQASWVEAVADGETTVQELLSPDTVQRVRADETLELLLGNGGGVSLTVNGETVATGAEGEVTRLAFELRNGRVVSSG
jgi:cytoskeleton protein RodZ